MSFDFSTLVTDRTQADVNRVKQIAEKIKNGTASESELSEFNSASMKGAYNYTDLNRVTAAMEALKTKLEGYGYAVPGYQRIKVPHVLPEPEPTSRLPEGYTELTYIESTGTQYINTNFTPNQDTRLVMDFKLFGGTDSILFGARGSSTLDGFTVFKRSSGYWAIQYNDLTSNASVSHDSERHVIDKNKNVTYLDGVSVCTHTAGTFTAPSTLCLLATNDAGTVRYASNGIIYSCQIYDNGTLARDYVPCINPDGEVGLYDLVTAAFFGNSGTGSFACNLDFTNQTWQQIVDACKSNSVPSIWNVGDQKTMAINGTDYVVDIIGKNHDTFADGSGKAPLTFQLHDCYETKYPMNSSGTNSGGWQSSALRTTTLPSILAFMPSEVQTGIKAVNKLTTAGSQSATINTTADKLFILSEVELFGATTYSFAGEGAQYEYYSNGGSKVKKVNGSADHWWERSPYNGNTASFCMVYNTGAANTNTASYSRGVSFAFCFACDGITKLDSLTAVTTVNKSGNNDVSEYDPYTWYEFDWPTPEAMALYLLNVAAIRSVLAVLKSTPKAPSDVVGFMVQEANDIEAILLDVYAQLLIMPTTFVACGEAFCGGDNL